MERLHGSNKAPKLASEDDFISRMPENVITNILNRLPIQNAVGTGILSRNWRFKWNLLTQLVFDINFFKYLLDNDEDIDYTMIIISRILLDLKGPITKFVLNIPDLDVFDAKDIFTWVLLLWSKGIKDLTLTKWHGTPFKLSTLPFSCLDDVTDLTLIGFSFHITPSFRGFPKLLSLDLDMVTLENGNIGEIINQCPLLENLVITNYDPIGEVKLVYFETLENLKRLSVPVRKLDNIGSIRSYIFQLGRFLPKLQSLTLSFSECKFVGEGETCAIKSARTIFPCLRTLELYEIDLTFSMLSCATKMIWGSPNLKSLTIMVRYEDDDDATPPPSPPRALISSKVDYNTLGQLQLQYVEFVCLGSENEVRLIKYLLDCSPLLKKMVINTYMMSDGKMEFAKKLLKLHRASPTVDVEFSSSCSLLNFFSVSYNHGS